MSSYDGQMSQRQMSIKWGKVITLLRKKPLKTPLWARQTNVCLSGVQQLKKIEREREKMTYVVGKNEQKNEKE